MSTTIDQKVVEMRFDNRNFESNVSTTLSSLEKLKQGLNMSGAAKGLEEVNAATKKCDMSGLSTAVETVKAKFSALEVMGVTALANITNSAVNAGKRIASALTIDPIKTGFSEYETKINAIQTIMSNTASKGTTMEDVTKVIGELNTYADKTIYNFAEMTRNIGTFTAAGVGLEESAAAIQGIANLAAASGSSSQQASTAMYQLSQALSTGVVKLMDWNSVVNAGMGGEKFQEALKATAREHGVAVDDIIKKNGSFRDSLQDGWLSADILNETLRKFTVDGAKKYAESMVASGKYTREQADALIKEAQSMEDAATKVKTFTQLWDTLKESAQSGWSQTWEIVVGDFEEAKETLTKFSDVIGGMIGASADARNELLQGWKDEGGRADLIDSLYNAFEAIMSIVKPIKEAFREIFPPLTVKQLVGFTAGLKELTAKMKIGEKTSDNLKRTFRGLFAIFDIGIQLFSAIFKGVTSLFGGISKLGGGILETTASWGDWLVNLSETIRRTDIFNKGIQKIVGVIKSVIGVVKKVTSAFGEFVIAPGLELIGKLMSKIGIAAFEMSSGVGSAFSSMGSALEGSSFYKLLKALWDSIAAIGTGLAKAFGALAGPIFSKLANMDFSGILDFLNTLIASGIGVGIFKLINSIRKPVESFGGILEGFSGMLEGVTGILDGVKDCFAAYQQQLKAGALMKIAGAIAILTASILVLSLIDNDKLTNAIGAITMLFIELTGAMAITNKLSGGFQGITKITTAMIGISVAVLILASALKKLSGLDSEEMFAGVLAIMGLTGIIIAAAKILGSGGKTIIKGATQMVIFAAAIKVLASACADLAYLSWEELAKGLVGVGVLLAEVSLFMNTAKFSGKSITTATGIVILSSAIKILASACEDFSYMSWEDIGKGLASIAGLLAEIVIFTKLTSNANKLVSTGVAMIAIGAAIKIFASAVQDLAHLSWEEIAKGLIGMAGALASVVIAMKLMPKNLVGQGLGLIAISSALMILSSALTKMGNMSWESIGKGFVVLGGSLAILAVGLRAMKGTLAGSAALVIAAAAISLFTPVLGVLGGMSWGSIVKGLVAMAGAFTVVGVAGALIKPVIGYILAFSAAIALVGVGMLAAGVGLMAFGAGLTALATGFVALVGSLGAVVSGLIGLISAVIEGILTGIAKGIVAFCNVIIDGIPAIGEAIKVLVLTLCDVLISCAPVLVDTVLKLAVSLLEALVEYTPTIVDKLFQFIIGIIDGIAQNLPDLIKSAVNLVMSLFQGVIDALKDIDPTVLIQGITAVGLMAGLIAALAAIAPMVPLAMVGVLGMGVVIAELALVLAAIGALAQIPGLEWLINEAGPLMESIGRAIGGLVGGVVGGIVEGITSSLPQIATDLSTFMYNLQPFIDGAKSFDSSVLDGVYSLVGVILALTAANVLDGLASWFSGGSALTKFGKEIAEFGPNLQTFANSVAGMDTAAVEAAAQAAKVIAEMTNAIPNEGGVISWFAGDNSISKFASELPLLGAGLKGFSDAVAGIVPENITAAAAAAKSLADMANIIPNEGGVVSWFAGENSISKFGDDLPNLGKGLKGFSDAIAGIVPENITAAATAAKSLAEMANTIPNEGGVASWFAGDNSIAAFADGLIALGGGLKGFADAVAGIVPENVTAAAAAAKSLAEVANIIPNEGGIVAWFAGENSLSKFSGDIVLLGQGLKGFSDAVTGIVPENVTAAASAAKSLAEVANIIPNEGGMVTWFTGENSISKFGSDLPALGKGLKGFSDSVAGIVPENVTAAASAAKSLAEVASTIPNEGGVVSWFTGEKSLSKFSSEFPALGKGLKGFSDSIQGIVPENVTAAANAAKSLASLTEKIPNANGVAQWFTGEKSLSKFSSEFPALGKGLKGFSDSIKGIVPENITAAANAAKSISEMTNTIPDSGGVTQWFTGEKSLSKFAGQFPELGKGIKGLSDSVKGMSANNVTAAANAAKTLAEMTQTVPGDSSKIVSFGDNIKKFGERMKSYLDNIVSIGNGAIAANKSILEVVKSITAIDSSKMKSIADGIKEVTEAIKGLSKINSGTISTFKKALGELGEVGVDAFLKAFKDIDKDVKAKAISAANAFVTGINESKSKITTAGSSMVTAAAEAIKNKQSAFKTAGAYLVEGFANGISANSYKAEAKARAMAAAAAKAAKKELDEHSPSKVGYEIGDFFGIAFVNGISDNVKNAYDSSTEMAASAKTGLNDALSRVANAINSDMDFQPTIRPVLDLSDVRAGAHSISGMFGMRSSVGVLANVGAISSMMNQRNQNGSNGDVVSAIDKLRKDLGKVGNTTYTIGGITYDDGSNISDAVQSLVRAAKVERRI